MSIEGLVLTANIRIILAIIGAILCFVWYRKRKPEIKILGLVLIASALGDLSVYIFFALQIKATNYSSSIYQILAVPLFSGMFYYAIGKRYATLFVVMSAIHVLFGVVNLFLIQKGEINSHVMASTSIICILFCVVYFYWLLKELPAVHVQRLPMFWITTALMLYLSGALFIFIFTPYLVNTLGSNLLRYWPLHNFLGILEEVIFIFALCLDLRNIKSVS